MGQGYTLTCRSSSGGTGSLTATGGSRSTSHARYRTKIELLRDLVAAASREERKTRLIGIANLNRRSFDRYTSLAMSLGLVRETEVGFTATAIAGPWLASLEDVMSKSSELTQLMDEMVRAVRPAKGLTPRGAFSPPVQAFSRLLGRLAWDDLLGGRTALSGGQLGRGPRGSRPAPAPEGPPAVPLLTSGRR